MDKKEITKKYYEELLRKSLRQLALRKATDLMEPVADELINLSTSYFSEVLDAVNILEKEREYRGALQLANWATSRAKMEKELEFYEKFKEKAESLENLIKTIEKVNSWLREADEKFLELKNLIEERDLDTADVFLKSLEENDSLSKTPQFYYLKHLIEISNRNYDRAAYYLLKGIDEALNRADIFGHSLLSSKLDEISDKADIVKVREEIEKEKRKEEKLKEIQEEVKKEEVKVTTGLKRSLKSLEKLANEVLKDLEETEEEDISSEGLDDLFIRAVNSYEAFEYEFAEAYLKEYLTKKPEDVTAQKYLARTYYQLEAYDIASKIYSNIPPEDLESVDYIYYVDSLLQQKETDKALEFLENVKTKEPVIDPLKAMVYAHKGKLKNSITLVKKLLKKSPHDWMSLYSLGIISIKLKKYKEATKHVKLAQKYNPSNFRLLEELVNLFILQGDIESAVSTCKKAVNYIKPSYKAKGLLVKTLLRVGEIEKAEKVFKELAEDEGVPKLYKMRLEKLISEAKGETPKTLEEQGVKTSEGEEETR